MRIGIDARMMSPKATRGIGRYIEELIRAMLAMAPEHQYVLVTRHPLHPFATHPSVETVVADIPWYGLQEQLRMPGVFRRLQADVIHVPHWNVPIAFDGPLVVTIHDLLLRHERWSARISTRHPIVAWTKRLGYRLTLSQALRHAKCVLVPTEYTRQDLLTLYPHALHRVVVTGEGMSHARRGLEGAWASGVPRTADYLLYVGSAYPHKGLDLLIDTWAEIEPRHPTLKLKIAGGGDVFFERLTQRVHERGLHRIEFLGHVSEEELSRLYQDALAFVFPSRFEGFGLPPLEALKAGCPVVSSNATALPEVLGSEGIFFFESGSKFAMMQTIEAVLDDPEAARRAASRALPDLQARHDWQETARLTLTAYASCLPHAIFSSASI